MLWTSAISGLVSGGKVDRPEGRYRGNVGGGGCLVTGQGFSSRESPTGMGKSVNVDKNLRWSQIVLEEIEAEDKMTSSRLRGWSWAELDVDSLAPWLPVSGSLQSHHASSPLVG